MNEQTARKILGDIVNTDGSLGPSYGHYVAWAPGDQDICLDSNFTVEELEALVWWMRNICLRDNTRD